jgi:hypothetical protein
MYGLAVKEVLFYLCDAVVTVYFTYKKKQYNVHKHLSFLFMVSSLSYEILTSC